jgi:malate dehydrogenase (oxaloacetate-decarboxylating)
MPANTSGPRIPGQRIDVNIDADPAGAAAKDVPRAVAVVSDGSALRIGDRDAAADSLAVLLEDDAAGLSVRAGVPVWAAPLAARDAEDLATQLRGLPSDTGAIFLTHTDPARARAVQQAVQEAGGPPVLTDADTTMISLTAALLTTIARAGREPATSRVVVAGASTLPGLCPLLIVSGVRDISSWNASDAHAFPLYHLVHHATAVIDLLGATTKPSGWTPGDSWSSVVSPDDPGYRLLPAPGLFAGLVRYPGAALDLDVFRMCALTLTAATPSGELVPEMDDPHLTEVISSAVLRVLSQRKLSGYQRPPRTTT